MHRERWAVLVLGGVLVSCAGPDYAALDRYYSHEPRTVLVLPVRNETTDAEAPWLFLSTIARPLALRGYYVLPIESTMAILEREGILDPALAWEAEVELLHEHLGADAVLYITIETWDTSYAVISSSVAVAMHYRLVDTRTGETLWERDASATKSSGGYLVGGGGWAGLVVGIAAAAVDAAMTAALTEYVPLASQANREALVTLPPGAYHRDHEAVLRELESWRAEEEARATEPRTR